MTFDGSAVAEPKNVIVPIGTSINDLAAFAGGYKSEPNAILNKLQAIWLTLSGYGINYALPPRGEIDVTTGVFQKVRTPS